MPLMKYPTRCEIVDATGHQIAPGLEARTPDVSKPHIGKQGLAEWVDGHVRITLDDGTIIYGSQCWWIPVVEEGDESKKAEVETPQDGQQLRVDTDRSTPEASNGDSGTA